MQETDAERVKILENQVVGVLTELTEMRRERDQLRDELARVATDRADLLAAFIDPELKGPENRATGRWRAVGSPERALADAPAIPWDTRAQAEAAALSSVRDFVGPTHQRERIWAATLARR